MTIGTDNRLGSFTREELGSMTLDTGRVFRKFRNIRKGVITFANFARVFGWNRVAQVARKLLSRNVGGVTKLRVVNTRFCCLLLRTTCLRVAKDDGKFRDES